MRLLLVTALLLGTTGCAAFSDDTADDGKVSVAAAFYPLAFVAQRVGGDDVAVTNLTQPGNEPHDLELDIKTTAEVSDADLVLLEHGFQPAVDDAVAEVAEGDVLDVADVVDLEDSTEDPGEKDPHFWQDPARMATSDRRGRGLAVEGRSGPRGDLRRQRAGPGRRPRPARERRTSRGCRAARGTRSWSPTTRSPTWTGSG